MVYPSAFTMARLQGLTTPDLIDAIDLTINVIDDKRKAVEASLEQRSKSAVDSRQSQVTDIDAKIAASKAIIEAEEEKIQGFNTERETLLDSVRSEQRKALTAKTNFDRVCELKAKELSDVKANILRFAAGVK